MRLAGAELDETAARNIHSRGFRLAAHPGGSTAPGPSTSSGSGDSSEISNIGVGGAAVVPAWDPALLAQVGLTMSSTDLASDLEIQRHITAPALLLKFDNWATRVGPWAKVAVMESLLAVIPNLQVASVKGPHHAFAMAGTASEEVALRVASFFGAGTGPRASL